MCLYLSILRNRKYTANKKNGGVIPKAKDWRAKWVPIGCGKCMECMKQKGNQWKVRLSEEIKSDNRGYFVTLTFNDRAFYELGKNAVVKGYELDNKIAKRGVRMFLERWRKKYKKSVKHWLVTELGEKNGRMHMHGIIWCDDSSAIEERWNAGIKYEFGHVFIGNYVNMKTINYIVKYIMKQDENNKDYKPIILTSKGIGAGYIGSRNHENNYVKDGKKTDESYRMNNGAKIGLPIYYRNYSYTDEEKEDLWMQKLDEEIRYVNGVKVPFKKGAKNKEYWSRLKQAQAKNKRLGFGSNKKNWSKIKYQTELKGEINRRIKKIVKNEKN